MRLVMMGTGTFAEPTFEALLSGPHPVVGLVTQPDRAVGQERGSTRQTGKGMKAIAEAKGVPVYQPESVNTPDGVAKLKEWQAELLVVAAYGQILSKDVLEAAPRGGINVHASLLPKYRGAAPVAWAIYHGETRTGVTIIRMTTGLDAGDMLAQEAIDILPDETAGELEARLAPLGARLALKVIDEIAVGAAHGAKQDKAEVTKAPKLKKEDGLIDWRRGAAEVCNQIRAMQPWPTAYTFFHREGKPPIRILVTRARSWRARGGLFPSGTLYPIEATGEPLSLFVEPGVQILELQPAGKKRMSAAEFLRGHPIKLGDTFGPENE
ncbi:MAG TPA: methionyl-tRNA formyltransferase [Gemmataceae bacterium]|nr:methionyl-tRNA formyltransferase [Gemmataceae bacterium]